MADEEVVWQYSPNFGAAVAAVILYGLVFLVLAYQTIFKYRAWFATTVLVGAAIEVVGYGFRCASVKNQTVLVSLQLP
jgi:hypothetical protein